ncbi:hypothetical protein [Vibrio quintilis]|uniref:Lipoprotein n=1 Tax=Vibrio quintilis TaxID=1117707 RepID=A0A1M7YPE1_9VIBR|nr:hypothetical protein [Vibrio quintilis]SHO54487.1 hypothetical protein VQ7734_00201 [Vibrio quintilis]
MKLQLGVSALVLSSVLTGCGGGDGGTTTSTSSVSGFSKHNGIYVNTDDLAVMLIDSTRSAHNLIVGDFAGNSVYFTDSGTVENNDTYKSKGLTYTDESSFLSSSSLELTATFTDTTATLNGTVNNKNVVYSFDKSSDSKSLDEITGTYTDSDSGAVWTVDSGYLAINGDCLISAKLTRNGSYFNLTEINASNCNDSSFDGQYDDGVLMTIKYQDHDYLAGIMGNDEAIMWGRVAIN